MNHTKKVILKKGRDKAIRHRHHWIFSGAVEKLPDFTDGDILSVYSFSGEYLGNGYFNRKANIIGRMLSFDVKSPMETLKSNLDAAIALRKALFKNQATNAYRIVNGEGDFLPGLIVDRYADALVIQISTLGMEKLREKVIDYLVRKLQPKTIYEKSLLPSRKEEGLGDFQALLYGTAVDEVEIVENGLKFIVSLVWGQKTGFFLDHREMRQLISTFSAKKRVLNCFSYTGGFSVYAAEGGALSVDSVEISEKAVEMAQRNMVLNGFTGDHYRHEAKDVFQFLRQKEFPYDLVILDPPAFAKRKEDIVSACRGYKDINRLALQQMSSQSILLTSSCSYHVNEALFQKVIFQASIEANKKVRIISRHHLASDHPINICHPEGEYLKSLLLYIEN